MKHAIPNTTKPFGWALSVTSGSLATAATYTMAKKLEEKKVVGSGGLLATLFALAEADDAEILHGTLLACHGKAMPSPTED